MNNIIECFGEITCKNGLKSLEQELNKLNYKTEYRESYGGKNFSLKILFLNGKNFLETEDSDGINCNFYGEFESQLMAEETLDKMTNDLRTLRLDFEFELNHLGGNDNIRVYRSKK